MDYRVCENKVKYFGIYFDISSGDVFTTSKSDSYMVYVIRYLRTRSCTVFSYNYYGDTNGSDSASFLCFREKKKSIPNKTEETRTKVFRYFIVHLLISNEQIYDTYTYF